MVQMQQRRTPESVVGVMTSAARLGDSGGRSPERRTIPWNSALQRFPAALKSGGQNWTDRPNANTILTIRRWSF